MRRALISLLCLGQHQGLHAQSALATGASVRITSIRYELRKHTGRVLVATPDTIVVQMNGHLRTDTLALSVTAIDHLEVGRPGRGASKRGARIGAALGATGGLAYGLASYKKCHTVVAIYDPRCLFASRGTNALVGTLAGGVVGAAVGGLVGSLIRSEKWVEVPTHRSAVSLRHLPAGGVGLGITVSF